MIILVREALSTGTVVFVNVIFYQWETEMVKMIIVYCGVFITMTTTVVICIEISSNIGHNISIIILTSIYIIN